MRPVHRDATRPRGVIVEQVTTLPESLLVIEGINSDRPVEALQQFEGLGREAVLLIGCEIPTLIVLAHKPVHRHHDGEKDERVKGKIAPCRYAGASRSSFVLGHVTPP